MPRTICVTPAGRRRYMRILVPYILSCPEVDEYQIWMNTTDWQDLAFFRALAARLPKVRLVEQPDGVVNGNASINAFFRGCTDPDAVYIRFDDDVVWMEQTTIRDLAEARRADRSSFLLTPCVVNNAVCTNILINLGRINFGVYVTANALDPLGWADGSFAEALHVTFLENVLRAGQLDAWRFSPKPLANVRFSINCISWRGDDFAAFDGVVEGDEEEYLSVVKPMREGRANRVMGQLFVSHFAFFPQREHMDRTGVLRAYEVLMRSSSWVDPAVLAAVDEASGPS
jgi:hypothetical protein